MRLDGVVSGTRGGKINAYRVWVGKPERDHLGDLNAEGRMILKLG